MSQTSIQDTISQIANLMTAENADANEKTDQQTDTLMEELYAQIKDAGVLFLTYNKTTGYPHVDDEGSVWIFSAREYAEAAIGHFAAMHIPLFYKQIPNSSIVQTFAKLYTLGLEKIRLDNGQSTIVIERGKILAPPDWTNTPPDKIPVMNPKLQGRMIPFFQNLRNGIDYPGKKEMVQKLEAAMLAEVLPAKFLVPSQGVGNFGNLCDNMDRSNWFPVFTDWDEFARMYDKKQWTGIVMNYDEVLRIAGMRGIVINPSGMNFRISAENKGAIETFRREMNPQQLQPTPQPVQQLQPTPQPVQQLQPTPQPVQQAQPTPPPAQQVQPTLQSVQQVPNPSLESTEGLMVVPMAMYPGPFVENLKIYMKRTPEIRRAYITQVVKKGSSSFLVVVDFLGDQNRIFGELGQVANSVPAGIPVIFKEADFIGLELVKNTKPFYKKGLFQ